MATCSTCGKPIPDNSGTACPECERILDKISFNTQLKTGLSELVNRRINQLELETNPLMHLTTGVPNGYRLTGAYGIVSARCIFKADDETKYHQLEENLLKTIDQDAVVTGANAIIGIRVDYTPLAQEDGGKLNGISGINFKSSGLVPIILLTITGTAFMIETI